MDKVILSVVMALTVFGATAASANPQNDGDRSAYCRGRDGSDGRCGHMYDTGRP